MQLKMAFALILLLSPLAAAAQTVNIETGFTGTPNPPWDAQMMGLLSAKADTKDGCKAAMDSQEDGWRQQVTQSWPQKARYFVDAYFLAGNLQAPRWWCYRPVTLRRTGKTTHDQIYILTSSGATQHETMYAILSTAMNRWGYSVVYLSIAGLSGGHECVESDEGWKCTVNVTVDTDADVKTLR